MSKYILWLWVLDVRIEPRDTLGIFAPTAERRMIMTIEYPCVHFDKGKCKKFSDDKVISWCVEGPCVEQMLSNADRIRAMSDEELAEFLTHINPINCQDCAFSHGWRCQPDRDDYSDFEKCEEGRRRWLKQPAKGE